MMVSGVLMLHLIYGSFQTGTCGLSTSTVRGAKFVKVVHSNPPPPKMKTDSITWHQKRGVAWIKGLTHA